MKFLRRRRKHAPTLRPSTVVKFPADDKLEKRIGEKLAAHGVILVKPDRKGRRAPA